MSDQVKHQDLLEHLKAHALRYMLDYGVALVEIEAMIAAISDDELLKAHYALQFIDRLPESERDAAKERLIPKVPELRAWVVITSFPNTPKLAVPADWDSTAIDAQIEKLFGRQKDDRQHVWRYDSIVDEE